MLKNPSKMDELNENAATEPSSSSTTTLKCFINKTADKSIKQQQQQTQQQHRNNNNVNGKKYSSISGSSSGSADNIENDSTETGTDINDCTKHECRRLSSSSMKIIENGETFGEIGRIASTTPQSSTPPNDVNSASTSTDNLSFGSVDDIADDDDPVADIVLLPNNFISEDEDDDPVTDDLINDIVLLPNNFISEDELSINSDDCVYAYRGRDIGADNNGACGGGVNGVGDIGVGGLGGHHLHHNGDISQDDEPDYIEMDFDPDPPSDAINIDAGEQAELGNVKHIVPLNDEDGDIKIPREIDKIGEVVELNSMRCREMHDVPLPATTKNQRLNGEITKNDNDELAILQFEQQSLFSSIASSAAIPVKYTGTKPKIRSIRRQSSDRLLHGGGAGADDAVVPLHSVNNYQFPSTSSSSSLKSTENLDCFNCHHENLYTTNSKENGINGTPCKRCKLNQTQKPNSPRHHQQLSNAGHGNYFDEHPSCSSSLKMKQESSLTTASTEWNHDAARIKERHHSESPSKMMKMNQWQIDGLSKINSELCGVVGKMDETLTTLTATFETATCTKAIVIEKLTRIGIEPNMDEICQYFDEKSIPPMTIPEYLIFMSKLNCDHKRLKSAIRLACTNVSTNFSIEFIPDTELGPCTSTVSISVVEIMRRWTKTTNLLQILRIRNRRFHTMNVLGKLANIVRLHAGKSLETIDVNERILIPQYYKNGYFILKKHQDMD